MRSNIGDEPCVAAAGARLGGERQHDVLHEEVDADAVDGSAEKGVGVQEPGSQAEEVIKGGYAESDEVVQGDPEKGYRDTSVEGAWTEQASSDGVRDGIERRSAQAEEGNSKIEVEGSGNKSGNKNGLHKQSAGFRARDSGVPFALHLMPFAAWMQAQ
jgi:hypothetical protein